MINGIYDSHITDGNGFLGNIDERLWAMREARINMIVNYGANASADHDVVGWYLDRARDAGIRIALQVGWEAISADQTIAFFKKFQDHPACWGAYVGDEAAPGSDEDKYVREISRRVKKNSRKPTLYVSRPGRRVLEPFAKDDVASHLGPDVYPLGMPAGWTKPDPPVWSTAKWSREMVRGYGNKWAIVLQSFSWSVDYPSEADTLPWPNEAQMRNFKKQARKYGDPDLMIWFCMHCITDFAKQMEPWGLTPAGYWRSFVNAQRT